MDIISSQTLIDGQCKIRVPIGNSEPATDCSDQNQCEQGDVLGTAL